MVKWLQSSLPNLPPIPSILPSPKSNIDRDARGFDTVQKRSARLDRLADSIEAIM